MYVVTVLFHVRPEHFAAFLEQMHLNAAQSLKDEPGCRQFDVCYEPARPGEVFLYEIYDSQAAFQAHLKAPHFLSFDAAVADMVIDKRVSTFTEVRQ
jgi:(4S)-4-hydroxy-5-phosphonooxypentane-2,3-dione isomerase